jgi:hypothetical protein
MAGAFSKHGLVCSPSTSVFQNAESPFSASFNYNAPRAEIINRLLKNGLIDQRPNIRTLATQAEQSIVWGIKLRRKSFQNIISPIGRGVPNVGISKSDPATGILDDWL